MASFKLVCVALEGQILEKQQLLEGLPAPDTSVMEGIPPLAFLVPEEQPQVRIRPHTGSVPVVTDVLWAGGAAVWGKECL